MKGDKGDSEGLEELECLYAEERPRLEEAAETLEETLKETIGRLPHGRLVRAHMPRPHSRWGANNPRIKSYRSLRRKAADRGWSADEAMREVDDLVAARVVCNNLDDVYRFESVLREVAGRFAEPPVESRDYIENPTGSGYRSLHLYVPIDVGDSHLRPHRVTCEVQVRTLLQHAWAELSHHDIYKHGDELPRELRERFRRLGDTLAEVDEQASEIRARVMEEQSPPKGRPDLEEVTADGLVFLFVITFGREPAEYAVRAAREMCEQVGLESLEPLEDALRDEEARMAVTEAYEAERRFGLDREELFELLPIAASSGVETAAAEARRRGKADRAEIERRAREEILGELPETYDAFVEELRRGLVSVGLVAEVLDAAVDCWICGRDLVNPERLALGVCEHYGEGAEEPITDYLYGSGIATTAPMSSGLCDYHANVLGRGD